MSAQILAANQAFYDAFARRDLAAMDEIWARSKPCACVHPGWAALVGREPIMASWAAILAGQPPPIRCVDPVVHRLSADVAYVLCAELLPGGRLLATNVFVREDETWRLVHHHASMVAPRAGDEDADDDDDATDDSPPPGRVVN